MGGDATFRSRYVENLLVKWQWNRKPNQTKPLPFSAGLMTEALVAGRADTVNPLCPTEKWKRFRKREAAGGIGGFYTSLYHSYTCLLSPVQSTSTVTLLNSTLHGSTSDSCKQYEIIAVIM